MAEEPAGEGSPHYAKWACPDCGRFGGWIAWPRTPEWAARFVMPFGKYRGSTVAEVGRVDRGYLRWAAENLNKGIAEAARIHLEQAS
jgi:hypothetical protein